MYKNVNLFLVLVFPGLVLFAATGCETSTPVKTQVVYVPVQPTQAIDNLPSQQPQIIIPQPAQPPQIVVVPPPPSSPEPPHPRGHMFDQPRERTCPTCGGTGKITCTACQGRGLVPCKPCGGTGYIIDDSGKRVTCTWCMGKGERFCEACSGTWSINGWIPCTRCGGRGVITREY